LSNKYNQHLIMHLIVWCCSAYGNVGFSISYSCQWLLKPVATARTHGTDLQEDGMGKERW